MRWALLIAFTACSKTDPPKHDEPPALSASAAAAASASAEASAPKRDDRREPGSRPKREDRHEPASTSPKLTLAVTLDGAAATWTDAAFTGVPKLSGVASDGEARDVWSLRELVQRNAGPSARAVAVTSADGKQPIDPAAWADATRTPILHTTRRGTLKFRWADKDGRWGETIVRDVTGLEIVR